MTECDKLIAEIRELDARIMAIKAEKYTIKAKLLRLPKERANQ